MSVNAVIPELPQNQGYAATIAHLIRVAANSNNSAAGAEAIKRLSPEQQSSVHEILLMQCYIDKQVLAWEEEYIDNLFHMHFLTDATIKAFFRTTQGLQSFCDALVQCFPNSVPNVYKTLLDNVHGGLKACFLLHCTAAFDKQRLDEEDQEAEVNHLVQSHPVMADMFKTYFRIKLALSDPTSSPRLHSQSHYYERQLNTLSSVPMPSVPPIVHGIRQITPINRLFPTKTYLYGHEETEAVYRIREYVKAS